MAEAVFQGTFADFRMVRGRKVAQIIVEIPLEQAGAALDAMGGLPMPDESRWVAVARLQPNAGASPCPASAPHGPAGAPAQASPRKTVKQAWSEMKLSARAGIICNDPAFWEWATKDSLKRAEGTWPQDAVEAVVWLRDRTAVSSRKEYDTDPRAAQRYLSVEKEFLAHKQDVERYGGD